MPAHESAHGPALHFFIVIRRPTTPALYPAIGYGFVSFHINHGEIGIVAKCQATFVPQLEYALRAMRRSQITCHPIVGSRSQSLIVVFPTNRGVHLLLGAERGVVITRQCQM